MAGFGSLVPGALGDIDPFTGMPLVPHPKSQAAFNAVADHLSDGVRDLAVMPGRALGTYGEPVTEDEMRAWAPGAALGMIGFGRLPGGAPAGSIGSSGAKLVQPEGIRAYHGSPHDFDRFDLGKIGTGEGAQAYGHGLYFAENEGVARAYRDNLAQGPVTIKGQDVAKVAAPFDNGGWLPGGKAPNQSKVASYLSAYGDVPSAMAGADEGKRFPICGSSQMAGHDRANQTPRPHVRSEHRREAGTVLGLG